MFTLDENLAESRIGIEPGHRETDPGKQAAARQKPPPKYPGTYRDARLVFIQITCCVRKNHQALNIMTSTVNNNARLRPASNIYQEQGFQRDTWCKVNTNH